MLRNILGVMFRKYDPHRIDESSRLVPTSRDSFDYIEKGHVMSVSIVGQSPENHKVPFTLPPQARRPWLRAPVLRRAPRF
jgi:hypothetical protein